MNSLAQTLRSSIGKKLIMAVTGLSFCGFLAVHLAGNLILYKGAASFNRYAEGLHSLGALLTVAELGLLIFAVAHAGTGLLLFFENRRSRPVPYAVKKSAGGQSFASATMPYTGLLVLAFVIVHLIHFTFADKTGTTIFDLASAKFQNPLYVFLYAVGMVIVAIHVRHGLWSAFQTVGANHPKYFQAMRFAGLAFSVLMGIGFGLLPIYITVRF